MDDENEKLRTLVRKLEHPRNWVEVTQHIFSALENPTTHDAARAALYESIDAQPTARAAFFLGRDLLLHDRLERFEELCGHEVAVIRAGALESIWGVYPMVFEVRAEAMKLAFHGLHDQDTCVRQQACYAMKSAGGSGIDIGPGLGALCRCLTDEDADVRCEATWAVGVLGKKELDLAPLLDTLLDRLVDSNEYAREAAARAFWIAAKRKTDITMYLSSLKKAAGGQDPDLAKAANLAIAASERAQVAAEKTALKKKKRKVADEET